MKYPGKHKKKHERRDRSKYLCHGRCPSCRGYKGSTNNEPGYKKRAQRDLKERITTGRRLSKIKNEDLELLLETISPEDYK